MSLDAVSTAALRFLQCCLGQFDRRTGALKLGHAEATGNSHLLSPADQIGIRQHRAEPAGQIDRALAGRIGRDDSKFPADESATHILDAAVVDEELTN